MPKKQCSEFIDVMLETIVHNLKAGDIIKLSGFGKFWIKVMNEREGLHPKNGNKIDIPKKAYVRFTPSRNLKFHGDTIGVEEEEF